MFALFFYIIVFIFFLFTCFFFFLYHCVYLFPFYMCLSSSFLSSSFACSISLCFYWIFWLYCIVLYWSLALMKVLLTGLVITLYFLLLNLCYNFNIKLLFFYELFIILSKTIYIKFLFLLVYFVFKMGCF